MGRCVYAGIDEAGRGPVMGPLVVAGVACPDPDVLADLGVKDSKKLSPARRVRLDRLIRSTPDVRVAVRSLEAPDVDGQRARLSLNDIEVLMFQEIAVALAPRHIIVDAADVDAARFGRRIAMALPHGTTVHSEHKADDNHPVVAAASIVAKVHRDAAIGTLARRLERHMDLEMGSGYAHDPRTQAFLAAWLAAHGDLPEGTRRSWKPARTLMTLHQTPKLEAFAAVADAAGGHTKAPAADPQAPPPGTPRGHAPQARARSNPRRGRTPGATTP